MVSSIFELDPFGLKANTRDNIFRESLFDELKFHFDNNKLYKNFCIQNKFNPHEFNGSLGEIPVIPVQVFKTLGSELNSVDVDQVKMSLKSSATSGKPSIVPLDNITVKRQKLVMSKIMKFVLGSSRRPFAIMDLDPGKIKNGEGEARRAAINGYLNFASDFDFFVSSKNEMNSYEFEQNKFLEWASNLTRGQPVVIFGFTFLLYTSVFKHLDQFTSKFKLPDGSKLIHIGGWKKLEDQKVSKKQFNEDLGATFGISPSDVIDIYGFTEQMGLNYPDCSAGWKHVPLYSDVFTRSPEDLSILRDGEEGLLEFVSPLPHSYPGNVVLTDDLGILSSEVCNCGLSGKRFQVTGRSKKAEIRGCGDIIADKVINISEVKSEIGATVNSLNILAPHTFKDDIRSTSDERIQRLINHTNNNRHWLHAQKTEDLIGLIGKARTRWQESEELSKFNDLGLNYLISWSSPDNLRRMLDSSLSGKRGHLDNFLQRSDIFTSSIKCFPKGVVCHWLSGNVPLLGMFALIQSILTKNVNMLKVPKGDVSALIGVLRCFRNLVYVTPGGAKVFGDELLNTIGVVYFEREDLKCASAFSSSADVRIAWGGRDAVTSIVSLPKKYSCEDIIFGPKLSLMAIGKGYLNSDKILRKTLRRAATDASVFDQYACASPHTIFIEDGGFVSARDFAEQLSETMEKAQTRLPANIPEAAQANKLRAKIATHQLKGEAWYDGQLRWAVLYGRGAVVDEPTYGRAVTVRSINNISDIFPLIDGEIQTIGLGFENERRFAIADELIKRGASRCPDIGRMTHFDSPWDGVFLADRLVRWGSIGGPL